MKRILICIVLLFSVLLCSCNPEGVPVYGFGEEVTYEDGSSIIVKDVIDENKFEVVINIVDEGEFYFELSIMHENINTQTDEFVYTDSTGEDVVFKNGLYTIKGSRIITISYNENIAAKINKSNNEYSVHCMGKSYRKK